MSSDFSEKQDDTLRPTKTAESVLLPLPRDVFEKLYLTPKHPSVAGDLRKKLGNPTPICLMGFLVASTPNACILMGWRGAGGLGGAIIPVYIFFGGMVQVIGAIGEWIIGNTFSSAVFFTYGTFWIVQATTLMPFFATGLQYATSGSNLEGMETPMFHATAGFYYVALSIVTFVYLICSIRTNICLFSALFLLVITFGLFAGSYFQLALGATAMAEKLQVIGGAFNFALCMPIWHIFIAQLLESVDFPIAIPVGDLSTVVLGRSQKSKARQE
ncbi:plasma membrane ammonium transporter [Aspergillus taichungensis]|uniref:Plasma membrane ammonium transporter n=1 Tax=Aspergillus taichungensis TaxID=482145 RepID=A0A2J5HTQ6_9EURO|nr:plasma membrane ammonium transporter [Aspergillus taichungensis]